MKAPKQKCPRCGGVMPIYGNGARDWNGFLFCSEECCDLAMMEHEKATSTEKCEMGDSF